MKKNTKRKNLFIENEIQTEQCIPENISSKNLQITNDIFDDGKYNATKLPTIVNNNNKDTMETTNILKQEQCENTNVYIQCNDNNKMMSKIFQRKKGKRYGDLLPGEVGNLTRFIRKELFFRMKFVTDKMFDKYKIVDLCFEQINITNQDEKRLKEKYIIKVVKDALNSRRGYAIQLLTYKLKGKNLEVILYLHCIDSFTDY
jgi:hypothetical protein